METSVSLLNVNTKIGTIKIEARFMTTLDPSRLPEPDKVHEIIKKEFSHDLALWENARSIRNELRPYCYEVIMIPQLKGLSYGYEIIKK